MNREVRLLVAGDDGVGKSSMICTFVSKQVRERDSSVHRPHAPGAAWRRGASWRASWRASAARAEGERGAVGGAVGGERAASGRAVADGPLPLPQPAPGAAAGCAARLPPPQFPSSDDTPRVVSDVTLPPEKRFDDAKVTIMDSSPQDSESLELKVRSADAIILVYDVRDDVTFEHLSAHWLPLISKANTSAQVFIAGNKIDLAEEKTASPGSASAEDPHTEALRRRVEPLLQRYRCITDFLHVSASCALALEDLFWMAVDAVLNPVQPLYDVDLADLTPAAEAALRRLFRCFDLDGDGVLSDAEMQRVQQRCFGINLEPNDIEELKKTAEREGGPNRDVLKPYGAEGGKPALGFTPAGLLALCRHLVEERKAQVVWKMLRTLSYSDALEPAVPGALLPRPGARPPAGARRLSAGALAFLTLLHGQFEPDADTGGLRDADVAEMSALLPAEMRRHFAGMAGMNLAGWRARWALTAAEAPLLCARQLWHLGYRGAEADVGLRAFVVPDGLGRVQRGVVVGRGAKHALFALGLNVDAAPPTATAPGAAPALCAELPEGRYLILQAREESAAPLGEAVAGAPPDVTVICYDAMDAAAQAQALAMAAGAGPKVFLRLKDLRMEEVLDPVEAWCARRGESQPLSFTHRSPDVAKRIISDVSDACKASRPSAWPLPDAGTAMLALAALAVAAAGYYAITVARKRASASASAKAAQSN